MKTPLPTRSLPERPDLDHLKHQAKDLLNAFKAGDSDAKAEVSAFYRDADAASFALHDAQLALARGYGYDSWPKLKAYVDGVTIKRLTEAVRRDDRTEVRDILRVRPELVNTVEAWNNEQTALHIAVLGRMPAMVRLLMEFGADPHAGISPHTEATSSLTIATDREYDEIAGIIREEEKRCEAGGPTTDEVPAQLQRALRAGDEDSVIAILERHPEMTLFEQPGDRRTLLHLTSSFPRTGR